MVLVAFPAVYRSVTGWLEGYFSFLFAVRAYCFEHFSRTHVLILGPLGLKPPLRPPFLSKFMYISQLIYFF